MLVVEGKQLPEDRREKGEETSVAEDFPPVLRNENQVGSVDGQTLGQRHLARWLSLYIFLFLVFALVIFVLDETIPKELFIYGSLGFEIFKRLWVYFHIEQLQSF